jgi:hypothetical protein
MPKDATIIVRADEAIKARLKAAARSKGRSLSAFVIEAAIAAAAKEESRVSNSTTGFRGVPRFFRALCAEATNGGASGYRSAGYEIMRHVMDLIEGDDWAGGRLDELAQYARQGDDDAIIAWFQAEFPQCVALIPERRLDQFVGGVREAFDDEGGIPGTRP